MPRRDFRIVRDKFASDSGLPFGRLLSRQYVLSVLESEGHAYRSRVFCPLVTLWGLLSQSLSQDKSLNEVVSRILAHRVSSGLPACSASSAGYCKARDRFPLSALVRMAREVGRDVHAAAQDDWHWNGRRVFIADETGLSMPDTKFNRAAYPPPASSKPEIAFPMVRLVALISLATGTVIDVAADKMRGKGTGESSLLRDLLGNMNRGDVFIADRYYPSFSLLAELGKRGIDMVSVSHSSRVVDFSKGEQLGPQDHIVEWNRPRRREAKTGTNEAAYQALPKTIRVREFLIDIEGRNGRREKAIVISTMADPAMPQKELSDLYWKRWGCELDFRALKQSMQMDVLRSKTPDMIHKELWAGILAYNLLRGTMSESAKRSGVTPRQLSVKGAMQTIESFTPAMMVMNGNEQLYDAFLTAVSARRVGNRPGRQEPRLKKRRPCWTQMMMKPRDEHFRRLTPKIDR
jgi:Transposase DDE domain